MKYSKSFLAALMAVLLLALTACGRQTAPEESQTPAESAPEVPAPPSDPENQPPEEPSGSSSKVLVVYYSASGNTEAVAGYIAGALGAETFEIVPAEPYTSDDLNWRDTSSRVSREHDDPALRTMELTETSVEGWENYETVFIGYPIWWGITAWPVDNFITANDFTGKTVIPFCTSSSSGLGESSENLQALAPDANWLEGMRFPSRVEESEIVDWVESLHISE